MSTRATNAGTSDRSRLVNARVGWGKGPRNPIQHLASIQLLASLQGFPPVYLHESACPVAVSRVEETRPQQSSAPPWLSSCRAFLKNLNLAQTAIDIAALVICFLFICVTAAAIGAAGFILFMSL